MAERGFAYPLQLRWGDLDLLGHVNNVRHVEYAQEARIAFFTDLAADGRLPRSPVVVARQEIDYVRVLELTDAPVEVRVTVSAVGNSSFTVDQVIVGVGEGTPTFSRVRSVVVGLDPDTGRSVPLTDEARAVLRGLLAADPVVS